MVNSRYCNAFIRDYIFVEPLVRIAVLRDKFGYFIKLDDNWVYSY